MAIKVSLNKLTLRRPLADVIEQIIAEDIEILSVSPEHVLQVLTLSFHHRDPY